LKDASSRDKIDFTNTFYTMKLLIYSSYLRVAFSVLFVLIIQSGFSQISEEFVTPEVRSRMDINKAQGNPILQDIYINYIITFFGVGTDERFAELSSLLTSQVDATIISFEPSTQQLQFTCPAANDLDFIKMAIKDQGFEMNYLNSFSYYLKD
jgi:hypothetical protein